MNTISIPASSRPLVWRFAWKEYRMLRAFWIASAVIGLLVQLLISATVQYRQDLASALFMVAWGGAAFYSVGAAIMMFAAETEDRTRDYLRLLPGDWRPIFTTKVLLALISAVLLGVMLTATGAGIAGSLPSQQAAANILDVAGIAVLEFLAWGLLFSMWWKHPLLAAVAGIAAASFGAQGAILATSNANNSWTMEAYAQSVPVRLAVCLIVFAVDVWLGRRWLYPVPTQGQAVAVKPTSRVVKTATKADHPRRRMFGRLLWQTWREAWKPILVALPLGIGLAVALLLPAYVQSMTRFTLQLPYVGLIPPALLGALAFRGDQQRDHRLFLATHAVWPRQVWLARQVVWLGTVLLLGLVIHFSSSWIMQTLFQGEVRNTLENRWGDLNQWLGREFSASDPQWAKAYQLDYMQATYTRGVLTTWIAFLAAYGIGQLCSMVLRQTLLSGFLAILLALVLAAWSVLMYLWEMPPVWFVLPLGIGALLATWLRVPSWILEQNRLKYWAAPLAAIGLPLVAMVALVPTARMAQINNFTRGDSKFDEPFAQRDAQREQTKAAASQTALEYERLGAQIDEQDELILKHFRADVSHEKLEELAEQLTELTKRPDCRIPSLHLLLGEPAGAYLKKLTFLLDREAMRLQDQGELDLAFERLCAELRLFGHKLQYQTSWQFTQIMQLHTSGSIGKEFSGTDVFSAILDWAQAEGQTSERIKGAISTLEKTFAELPRPAEAVYADRARVRRIILEEEPASGRHNQLALSLNRLPGEQRRALRALDLLSAQAHGYVATVEQLIEATSYEKPYGSSRAVQLRRDLLSTPLSSLYAIHSQMVDRDRFGFREANQLADACATSFLVANAFENSGSLHNLLIDWTDFVTRQRALLVQLALIAYKIDHGSYPATLDKLVPDYLPKMVHDPYSGEAFEYRPEGLNLPLVLRNEWEADRSPDIPADTPLLWSVGLGNNVLKEFFEYDAESVYGMRSGYGGEWGGTSPASEMIEQQDNIGRQVMGFEPTVGFRRGGMRYVFPLPQVEEADAEQGPPESSSRDQT